MDRLILAVARKKATKLRVIKLCVFPCDDGRNVLQPRSTLVFCHFNPNLGIRKFNAALVHRQIRWVLSVKEGNRQRKSGSFQCCWNNDRLNYLFIMRFMAGTTTLPISLTIIFMAMLRNEMVILTTIIKDTEWHHRAAKSGATPMTLCDASHGKYNGRKNEFACWATGRIPVDSRKPHKTVEAFKLHRYPLWRVQDDICTITILWHLNLAG